MSKYTDEFIVQLPVNDAMYACKDAAAELGWRIMEETENHIACKEVSSQVTSFTWPAKVDVQLQPSQGQTKVVFEGSILGFGSIQSNHLRGQMGRFRNLIERSAKQVSRPTQHASIPSISSEMQKLAELHSRGDLTDNEFKAAKEKLLGN